MKMKVIQFDECNLNTRNCKNERTKEEEREIKYQCNGKDSVSEHYNVTYDWEM